MNFFGSVLPAAAALEWAAMAMFFVAGAFTVSQLGEKRVKIGLAAGSVVFLALLAEGAARAKAAIAPAVQGAATHSYELWARRHVKRNPEGFRDALHVLTPKLGTSRLLCVGDSVAFGWGISRTEDRFGEQLAKRLQAKTRHDWESLNASEPNAHTLDHIRFLERMLPYRPDVVVLLYVFNDIEYLDLGEGRRFLGNDPFQSRWNPLRVLYENFYAFEYLFVWGRRVHHSLHKDAYPDPYLDPKLLARHLVDVARFQSIATQAGAVFALVPVDLVVVFEPKRRDRYRMFVQQAQASGLTVCSLDEAFDGYSLRDLRVSSMDDHPSATTHHRAADVAAGCLSKWLEG
jgi:lysophospholipase L1-like esterase